MVAQVVAFRVVVPDGGVGHKAECEAQTWCQAESGVYVVHRGVMGIDTAAPAFVIGVLQRDADIEDE